MSINPVSITYYSQSGQSSLVQSGGGVPASPVFLLGGSSAGYGGYTNNNNNGGGLSSLVPQLLGLVTSTLSARQSQSSASSESSTLRTLLSHLTSSIGGKNRNYNYNGFSSSRLSKYWDKDEDDKDSKTNAGALSILSQYSDDIGKNGKITQKDLKKFAKRDDIPESAKKAAKRISENDSLYNLLVQESGSTAEKGFKASALDTDFESRGMDIDNLNGAGDKNDAVTLVKDKFKDLSTDGVSLTKDDLKTAAKGKGKAKNNPELQAAALKILNEPDLFDELDGATKDGIIQTQDLTKWLKDNK